MTSSPTSDNETGAKEHVVRSQSNFTIDHILNKAGNSVSERKSFENSESTVVAFPWLHCTRYCPPKIPRKEKKEGPQKRQLGRHPRIPFTSKQLTVLEEKFRQAPYLSSSEVKKISRSLQLSDMRVKIWFQNRRARERRGRPQLEVQQSFLNSTLTSTEAQRRNVQFPILNEEPSPSAISKFTTSSTTTSMVPIFQSYPLSVTYENITNRNNSGFFINHSKSYENSDVST